MIYLINTLGRNHLRSVLRLESFEDRSMPAALIPNNAVVIAPEGGGIPVIKIVDPVSGADLGQVQAYEDSFRGGVNFAVGDITGDGVRDLVIAPGVGGGPRIRIIDGATGNTLNDFFVYETSFRGGVTVAVGDINGDGKGDIITGTGIGGGPRVRVLDGATLGKIVVEDYFAYESSFRGGVTVASGDVNGDGRDDIVTGAGFGGGPRVRATSGKDNSVLRDFFAYDDSFRGGVNVAVGDVNGDGTDDLISGTGPGGGPVVSTFSGKDGTTLSAIFTDDSAFRGGVKVSSDDLNTDGKHEVISKTRHGNQLSLRIFNGVTGQFDRSVGRTVDDQAGADDRITPIGGGTVNAGFASAFEGRITAINATLGTVDILLANGTSVVVQAGPGTQIERNHVHTTLASFVVGDKGEALIGPDGFAWALEARAFLAGENQGGSNNGSTAGKVEGIITAINFGANQFTIQRNGGTSVVVTVAPTAVIERNGAHVALAAFVVGDRGEALIGMGGLATKVEAESVPIGGGGGTIIGSAPPVNTKVEGTITAIDLAQNRVTIHTVGNVNYLIQVVTGTTVERNIITTTLASFKLNDQAQAETGSTGLVDKLEATGV